MEMTTASQLIVSIEDPAMLNSLKKAIQLLKGVSGVSVSKPKVRMSEKEFYEKLDASIESGKNGKTLRMKKNESGEQFINRILCHSK